MYLEDFIKDVLLEAVYITRWNVDKQSEYSLLSNIELKNVIDEILVELDNAGLKIVKK